MKIGDRVKDKFKSPRPGEPPNVASGVVIDSRPSTPPPHNVFWLVKWDVVIPLRGPETWMPEQLLEIEKAN